MTSQICRLVLLNSSPKAPERFAIIVAPRWTPAGTTFMRTFPSSDSWPFGDSRLSGRGGASEAPCSLMTFKCKLALVALAVSLATNPAVAQDSSRADWRAWFATVDSVAKCRKGQLLSRVYGVEGEYTVHRTPSGGTCQAGPGPGSPTAWVIDSRVFCPDSNPATWMDPPKHAPMFDENIVASL